MKKAIVTGANGFIGRFLVKELIHRGVNVIAIDRKGADWSVLSDSETVNVECDLSNIELLPELIADRDIDCVFHTAWQGVSDADAKNYEVQLNNVYANLKLIEAVGQMKIKTFIATGSIHEIEAKVEMNYGTPVTNLGNMYKTSKLAAHWMGKALAGSLGIRYLCPLIINTYGEQEKSGRLINTFIRKLLKGESPELSSAEQMYDFVYITDIAYALYLIGEKGVDGRNYIIGSGQERPLKEFLTEAGNIINKMKGGEPTPLGFGKYNGKAIALPPEAFDVTALFEDTGFRPRISFEEGIKKTAEYIISQG